MAVSIRVTPTFARSAKKLHDRDKKSLDDAVRAIASQPGIGAAKKGDLVGVYVYKFKINKQEVLLSYQFADSQLVLLSLGSHENFYRDLKH